MAAAAVSLPSSALSGTDATATIVRGAERGLKRETTYVYTPPNHRQLYRGALAVKGWAFLLDGLTFTIPLPDRKIDGSSSPSLNLLQNPLALALESMRGRTLRLAGTTSLSAVYLDTSGDVKLDIHAAASVTRMYFESQLCAAPITSADGTTDVGIRITLGDPDHDQPSDILVYGQLPPPSTSSPTPSSSSSPPPSSPSATPLLQLRVARIIPAPPPTPARLPRPDDPSPRMPPLLSFGKKRRQPDADAAEPHKRARVRTGSSASASALEDDAAVRHAREVMRSIPRGMVQGPARARSRSFVAGNEEEEDVFKVPLLPASVSGKEKEKGKGKEREREKEKEGASPRVKDAVLDLGRELEKGNKATIKKAAVDCLATYGVEKTNPEFKELWGFIYRGAEFALRTQMQKKAVDHRTVNRLVKAHAKLYLEAVPGSIPSAALGMNVRFEGGGDGEG
ncbi:hypothetical protein DENSPDRAFT_879762 [Dentipellis sp. KUC8613]|nr:hypothetical protein DENSPDRAFT_879762 [Dentipellis sp. KUC8613]